MQTVLTYQDEKDLVLEQMLNKFYKIYQQDPDNRVYTVHNCGFELYLTPDCNQNCSYCYLCKYKNELYPQELRNTETILKNMRILMDYLIENKINPPRFDLFSGEIWDTQFGYDVLQIVYEALQRGFKPGIIIIPSNFSFVLNDEALKIIDDYMQKITDCGVRLCWSCSNDGLYIDQMTRPFNNEEQYELKKGTEAYYKRIFDFCVKWNLGFHPMVSAHGIEYWCENFDWWVKELKDHNFDPIQQIMFLEVRNDDWTEDKIIHYLKYLNHSIDYYMNDYFATHKDLSKDPRSFEKWIHHKLLNTPQSNYSPLFCTPRQWHPGCTIHRSIVVRMGDLAIVPCHRTSYDEFIGGHYVVENDKIVGVRANNIQVMNQVWFNNLLGSAKCGGCPYKIFCMKGCYGSQFESTGELLYPCSTVCDLYQARFIFLYHKYTQLGVINEKDDPQYFNTIQKIKESKEYQKWTAIALSLI